MARTPLYRGQGNEPFIMSDPRQAAKRGQTVPYDVNGAPTGASGSAAATSFVPAGNLGSTNVQAALTELDSEKQQRGQPVLVQQYTVATLPNAAIYVSCAIIVSDEVGGRTLATSDGSDWRRVSDGAVVS